MIAEQRIRALIEKRTIDAQRKELTKKLYTIVKAFGRPIIEQNVSYTSLPDFWEVDAPELPEISEDNINLRGYYFDGLSRGINICIKLTIYDGKPAEIKCDYNGYMVYCEDSGELTAYAPFPAWEEAVERLYGYARPAAEQKIKEETLKQKESDKKRAMGIMQKLRLLWGI